MFVFFDRLQPVKAVFTRRERQTVTLLGLSTEDLIDLYLGNIIPPNDRLKRTQLNAMQIVTVGTNQYLVIVWLVVFMSKTYPATADRQECVNKSSYTSGGNLQTM